MTDLDAQVHLAEIRLRMRKGEIVTPEEFGKLLNELREARAERARRRPTFGNILAWATRGEGPQSFARLAFVAELVMHIDFPLDDEDDDAIEPAEMEAE